MSTNIILTLAVAFAVIAFAARLIAASLDRQRIAAYFATRGAEFLSASWRPFGNGWLGERGDRIYRVRYRDASGVIREADCKTRAFSGVYLSQDRVASP